LCQVMLFKMAALWMHLHCVWSCFLKWQPFECTSTAPGHAFQNASHLNAPLLHQVTLFKMPAIWMHLCDDDLRGCKFHARLLYS
jgi:hypothetical protein